MMIPDDEVGCKSCNKSIYRIFVEHIKDCIKTHVEIPKNWKELNPNVLKEKLNCGTIEGIWIDNRYYRLGIGSRFCLVVQPDE